MPYGDLTAAGAELIHQFMRDVLWRSLCSQCRLCVGKLAVVEGDYMHISIFRAMEFPPGEGFDRWHEFTRRAHVSTLIRTSRVADFPATLRTLDFGGIQVSRETFPAMRIDRTPKLIRQSDPEQYHVALIERGTCGLDQLDRNISLGAGDLTLYDTSQPFTAWTSAPGSDECGTSLRVQIPKTALTLRPHAMQRLLAARLPAREGIGALVTTYVSALLTHAGTYRAADETRLAHVTIELIATLIMHVLDAPTTLLSDTSRQTLLIRVQDFIRQNLGDPALSPPMIATAHHMSVRQLHRLFDAEEMTVAGWIREQRLERCHRDLADPRLVHRPIHTIASKWGFLDRAHFSRLFRAAFGRTPSEHRKQATTADQDGTH